MYIEDDSLGEPYVVNKVGFATDTQTGREVPINPNIPLGVSFTEEQLVAAQKQAQGLPLGIKIGAALALVYVGGKLLKVF